MDDNLGTIFFYKILNHKMKVNINDKFIKKEVQKTIIFISNAVYMLLRVVRTGLKVINTTYFTMSYLKTIFEKTNATP